MFKTLLLGSLFVIAGLARAEDTTAIDFSTMNATVVDFHIPAGTGSKAWNTLQAPIIVRVGQILRLHNDDDADHYLHTTNGAPCVHGTDSFGPGETYDCVIIKPHNASLGDCYDHSLGKQAQVYIQANP